MQLLLVEAQPFLSLCFIHQRQINSSIHHSSPRKHRQLLLQPLLNQQQPEQPELQLTLAILFTPLPHQHPLSLTHSCTPSHRLHSPYSNPLLNKRHLHRQVNSNKCSTSDSLPNQ